MSLNFSISYAPSLWTEIPYQCTKRIITVLYDPAGNGDRAAHLLEMWEGWQGLMNAGILCGQKINKYERKRAKLILLHWCL